MSMTMVTAAGSGVAQGALWSAAAEDWADCQERTMVPVFEAVLDEINVTGARVLDVGCGSGLFAKLIAARGAKVDGLDAADGLIEIARRRATGTTFTSGDMEELPYADRMFDVVTAINVFHHAADPDHAVMEACRVAKRGGQIVLATWSAPDRCEAAAYLGVIRLLQPASPPNTPGPFTLSETYALRNFVQRAGLRIDRIVDVKVPFEYVDLDAALRGLLSAGPAIQAIQASGRARVTDAISHVLESFRQPMGRYRLRNQFRLLFATRLV
jgi:ubiquinone/menaquinone biosynthesis C-methylase UbiE